MMDSGFVRNMWSTLSNNLRNSASRWLSLQGYITMHGTLNVKKLLLRLRALTDCAVLWRQSLFSVKL